MSDQPAIDRPIQDVHIIVHMPYLDTIYPYQIGTSQTLRFLQIRVQEFDSPTRLQ
jgi:hypothetical protein